MKFLEDDLQKATASYLDSLNLTWCHVANERRTTPQAGARLKKKGVKSGVPDNLIFNKNKKFNGLAIELKVGKNKPTDNQKKWLNGLKTNGWQVKVCYNIDEVITVVSDYLRDIYD